MKRRFISTENQNRKFKLKTWNFAKNKQNNKEQQKKSKLTECRAPTGGARYWDRPDRNTCTSSGRHRDPQWTLMFGQHSPAVWRESAKSECFCRRPAQHSSRAKWIRQKDGQWCLRSDVHASSNFGAGDGWMWKPFVVILRSWGLKASCLFASETLCYKPLSSGCAAEPTWVVFVPQSERCLEFISPLSCPNFGSCWTFLGKFWS